MGVDIQVVFPQETIELTSVRLVPGLLPKTLDITGADFTAVDQVLVNELESPSFVVVSRNRLLAQVPEMLVSDVVRTVSVTSRRLIATKDSLLRFRLSDTPGKVRGILRLMQLFLKLLLSTPGTDIFAKTSGGAALKNLGRNFGKDEGGQIVSDMVVSVDTTARQIVAMQGKEASTPPDEKLLSAKVLSTRYDTREGALSIAIELISQAGNAATANLTV